MKKFLIMCCLLCINIFLPIQVNASEEYTTMYTTTAVNVRLKPSLEAEIVIILPEGEQVLVFYEGKKWNAIKIENEEYYIYNEYLNHQRIEKKFQTEYSSTNFKKMGIIHWNQYKWTWYSQRVLPGTKLQIPGRHVNEEGYVVDENERVCLASSTLSKGTIVDTPFGMQGCVYDSGCAAGILDVYVDW